MTPADPAPPAGPSPASPPGETFAPLDVEDRRKLHAEINQIENHRFLLSTLAVTAFGVLGAWLVPRAAPEPGTPVGGFVCAGALLLEVLLFVLFLLHQVFKLVMRSLATYLVVRDASQWEKDWRRYRRDRQDWYSQAQTILFVILEASAAVFPLTLAYLFDLTWHPREGIWLVLGVGEVFLLLMLALGIFGWLDREEKIESRWREILREGESGPGAAAGPPPPPAPGA